MDNLIFNVNRTSFAKTLFDFLILSIDWGLVKNASWCLLQKKKRKYLHIQDL